MGTVTYYRQRPGTGGATREDWSPAVYEAGAAKPDGALTQGEIEDRFPAPEPPLPTLAEALQRAYGAIKAARDARLEQGGMVWHGYLVSIDKEATDRMTSTAMQFQAGFLESVRWKMSDGEYAVLDMQAFFAMAAAAGGVVQACYGVEEAKRREVEALPDAAAVLAWLDDAQNTRAGWPGDGAE